ncbi:nose resistant to fluoxetine protein 6-like [Eupeodes corollae]|uniref:nose resistant to fluoxetine protein 6-like n=1 Tax=Eupeodes corollae TaxID=290404 RepID=UPI002493CD04|nr:nose resistant to fluoxetine protein 6-like [Eupeodes corollae]
MYYSLVLFEILLFSSEIYSFSIVNNVSVSSDVLSQVFYDEMKNNPSKIYKSGPDFGDYNSKNCLSSLREIMKQYPSPQVYRFFDSWGSVPSGVLTGNQYDLGNYDQCVNSVLRVLINEIDTDFIIPQYCVATLPLKRDPSAEIPVNYWDLGRSINVGICVPNSCSPELLTAVFKESTKTSYDGALSEISIGNCSDGGIPQLTAVQITGIVFLVVITGLMILSSAYEVYVNHFMKKPKPIFLAFSILTNGRRLFSINTKRSRSSIDCLNGLRVISTLWIVMHHSYDNILGAPVINYSDLSAWFYSWEFMPIINASMTVDTFFFMGGLLVAWIGFKELDKTNGKINVFMNIVHRYIRLTPILAAGLILAYCINGIIYTGPFKDIFMAKNNCNGRNWWPILLYIQNYYTGMDGFSFDDCYAEAWYLAIDFQLYALSPLILIPMWKWGRKFVPVLVVLGLISIGWVMAIYFSDDYTALMLGVNPHEWERIYIATHTRFAPWLIGFGFGYFLHKNRQSEFKLSKRVQAICWIVSFFTMTAIIFGPYFSLNAKGRGTVFEAAMYESLRRVCWAVVHVWLTFACFYGYGGIVDAFLSHPMWQPFARLSYAMYMMHMAIVRMHYGMSRTEIFFSVYNQFLFFWSAFGITFLFATYFTLAFESPILILEKIVFKRGKLVKNGNVEQAHPPNAVVIESPAKDS